MVLYVNRDYAVAGVGDRQSSQSDVPVGTEGLIRVLLIGGPPQSVLELRGINNLQCARLPSTFCIFSGLSLGRAAFLHVRSVKGKKVKKFLQRRSLGQRIALCKSARSTLDRRMEVLVGTANLGICLSRA
jgi:hypothetical protein